MSWKTRQAWERKNMPKLPRRFREQSPLDPEKARRLEIARQVRETIEADDHLKR